MNVVYEGQKISHREMEILELVVKGKRNKEIAYKLKIADQTVKNYVSQLFVKTNTGSRVELAVKYSYLIDGSMN